jgi:hypothetical protein
VQIPGLRKLEQRTQIAGASGVNDDDALALFELGDDVAAVKRIVRICRCAFDRQTQVALE